MNGVGILRCVLRDSVLLWPLVWVLFGFGRATRRVFSLSAMLNFFFLLAVVLLSCAVVRWPIGASFSALFGL